MTTYNNTIDIDYSSQANGGDSMLVAVQRLVAQLDKIYGHLNTIDSAYLAADSSIRADFATADAANAQKVLIVVDEKANGESGGKPGSENAFLKRTLNTVRHNAIVGASVTDSVITLPAGTYLVEASAPGYRCSKHKARLYDNTGQVTLVWGTNEHNNSVESSAQTSSHVVGKFTLSATSALELQHMVNDNASADGFGIEYPAAGPDDVLEVYSVVKITKLG